MAVAAYWPSGVTIDETYHCMHQCFFPWRQKVGLQEEIIGTNPNRAKVEISALSHVVTVFLPDLIFDDDGVGVHS